MSNHWAGRGNPKFKHGRMTGMKEYRDGPPAPAGYNPESGKPPARPIIKDKKQKREVIKAIAARLRQWEFSPFQFEGACRHGLRQAFCSKGYAWQRSDDEAAHIVHEALLSNGAKRPTWEEGQWRHTVSRDYCVHCQRPMEEEEQSRGKRFCSPECAKSALQNFSKRDRQENWAVAQSAYKTVRREKRGATICLQCKEPFHPMSETARFCSRRCACLHAGTALEDRECPECHETFRPNRGGQVYCSAKCSSAVTLRAMLVNLPIRTCQCCGEPFKPQSVKGKYCSRRCLKRVDTFKSNLSRGTNLRITPVIFDHYLTAPINLSTGSLTPERFDHLLESA